MVSLQHPIRTTIVFGIICGLSFIPANLALDYLLPGESGVFITLWMYAASYSLLLSRWVKKTLLATGFPLLLLFATSLMTNSIAAFYLLSLGVVSWIRSGICFRYPGGTKWAVELLLCVLSGIPMVLFTPGSGLTWLLGIWMFFLIQSLYFVIFENRAILPEDLHEADLFERASRQAEAILSDL